MTANIDEFPSWQRRTAMLTGRDGLDKLKKSHVLVVGLGGVGAYAAELIKHTYRAPWSLPEMPV